MSISTPFSWWCLSRKDCLEAENSSAAYSKASTSGSLVVRAHCRARRGALAFGALTSIQPELWVDAPTEAVAFYEAAFGATVLHRVGDREDIVAQLAIRDAAFWVAASSESMRRLSPRAVDGATGRTLLVVDDPEMVVARALAAGATESSPVSNEHGWRLGRIVDPFGHEWEIRVPLGPWPPSERRCSQRRQRRMEP